MDVNGEKFVLFFFFYLLLAKIKKEKMSYEKLPEEKKAFNQAARPLQAPLMETEGPWARR